MSRVFAVLTVAMFVAGCSQDPPVKGGLSLQQQEEKRMKAELKKIQSQIDQNMKNAMTTGQNAIQSARPRTGR